MVLLTGEKKALFFRYPKLVFANRYKEMTVFLYIKSLFMLTGTKTIMYFRYKYIVLADRYKEMNIFYISKACFS